MVGQRWVGGWWWGVGRVVGGGRLVGGGWVSCSILESAPVPFGFRYYWNLVGVGPRGLGTGLDNYKHH